ncbi:flavodoxin [Methanocorpusculum vombati]|uniref:flavodoxin n=1 Tax=Methanocorpusculum vombati TaxID=3002864 RepID=UPI0022A77DA3|nr:flavodoxin [Methanocorpusculum vombati]MCZ9320055.1 flavodoxin [Methanocorpusculum sp.]MDE2520194.1 flavodoxin [Methanocorpusculum sp.]MDE2534879.1 flavodoxin [Methanocorpusculum sp.]MDE2545936.1 flavodoxin [Methanocorpusculum sp.]MDE2548836.1 flavodoxin [Methanocorpusculum sp.]
MTKNLIVYYSHSSHTANLAKMIQKLAGGTLCELIPRDSYPSVYRELVDQAKKEITSGYLPELKVPAESAESYDIIFLGTPNWWSTLAPPVATFLHRQSLAGKTVVPFCTHGGGGSGRVSQDIAKLCPDAVLRPGFAAYENSAKETDVAAWLAGLGVL